MCVCVIPPRRYARSGLADLLLPAPPTQPTEPNQRRAEQSERSRLRNWRKRKINVNDDAIDRGVCRVRTTGCQIFEAPRRDRCEIDVVEWVREKEKAPTVERPATWGGHEH